MLQQRTSYAELAIPHKKPTPNATQACVFPLKKPRQRTPKHFEYDQIKIKIIG